MSGHRINRLDRTIWLHAACALLAIGLAGCQKRNEGAANYPNRSIELIVPWAAGGGTDRVARFIADALQRRMGQPVIVVNRTGGSGAVGHSAGALAAPDGHTLTMATFELSTMRAMAISKLSTTGISFCNRVSFANFTASCRSRAARFRKLSKSAAVRRSWS